MSPKRIQMSRQKPWRADNPDAVIVARPSMWGNPHPVGELGWNPWYPDLVSTAIDAVIQYELDLWGIDGVWWEKGYRHVTNAEVVLELAGRDLACWCSLDAPCHGDVLLKIANA